MQVLIQNLLLGDQKSGVLNGIPLHKIRMLHQLRLLGYRYEDYVLTLTLLALGSHENFYRDLKLSLLGCDYTPYQSPTF